MEDDSYVVDASDIAREPFFGTLSPTSFTEKQSSSIYKVKHAGQTT